jgi:serine/threonine protein kinase
MRSADQLNQITYKASHPISAQLEKYDFIFCAPAHPLHQREVLAEAFSRIAKIYSSTFKNPPKQSSTGLAIEDDEIKDARVCSPTTKKSSPTQALNRNFDHINDLFSCKKLGAGGEGDVHLVIDGNGHEYAFKTFKPYKNRSAEEIMRAEFSLQKGFDSPHLLKAIEQTSIGSVTGLLYPSMGPNANLRQKMRAIREAVLDGSVTIDDYENWALNVLTQCIKGIQDLHQTGIVHRDIKLENILLSPEGQVKIADFGHSNLSSDPELKTKLCGTAGYIAPENINSKQAYDEPMVDILQRSDAFSLGQMFYQIFADLQQLRDKENGVLLRQPTTPGTLESALHRPYPWSESYKVEPDTNLNEQQIIYATGILTKQYSTSASAIAHAKRLKRDIEVNQILQHCCKNDPNLIDLIKGLLHPIPQSRLSINEALEKILSITQR